MSRKNHKRAYGTDIYKTWVRTGKLEEVLNFITECAKKLVTQTEMCKTLKMDPRTFSTLKKNHPYVQEAIDKAKFELKKDLASAAPRQTIEGFYKGYSIPVNEDLSSIFLATHLSERTGKGNPLIVSNFGRKAFQINEDSIIVTIPYNWIRSFKDLVDKSVDKLADKLSKTELKILYAIKENPKMSQIGIAKITNTGKTTV